MRDIDLLPSRIASVKRSQAVTPSSGPGRGHVRYERVLPSGFGEASELLMRWAPQRAAFRVRATSPTATPGAIIEMGLACPLRLVRFYCRVTEVVDEPGRRGFIYGTLPGHPESGEERFLVELRGNGQVVFVIEAVSRPSNRFWRAVRPLIDAARWVITTRRYLGSLDSTRSGPT